MCGIVGIISNKNISKKLIDKLSLLEYRGHDSAGVGWQDEKIHTLKVVGNVSKLTQLEMPYFNCGIAHTRWATRGKPSLENCHPHTSTNNEWAIVHNGIIENHLELKAELIKRGKAFISNTDTEVAANLFENDKTPLTAMIDACNKIKGSYAFVCINKKTPNTLFLAKRKSPLYISQKGNEIIVASDTICFDSRDFYTMEDNEFAIIDKKIRFYDSLGKEIVKTTTVAQETVEDITKHTKHYMLKEIQQTPALLENIINNQYTFDLNMDCFDDIYFIGCGSAYNSGLLGKYYANRKLGKNTECFLSSEFIYENRKLNNSLCVFISQSGETADTLTAQRFAKDKGAKTVALVNNLQSSLARNCDEVLPIMAGREIAVASTKAYTCQSFIMYLITYGKCEKSKLKGLKINYSMIDNITEQINRNRVFFIGRDVDYLSSIEASLKLKEITYINSSTYPSGELKHGPLALIENGDIIFVIVTQNHLIDKVISSIYEIRARGGRVFIFSQFERLERVCEVGDIFCKLEAMEEKLMPLQTAINFQYLAYATSVKKGINPDQPRNLAKSVTVE